MKSRIILLFVSTLLLVAATSDVARAQEDRFTATQQPIYLVDANGKPWSDLSYQLRVKLDSEYTKDLGANEISIDKPQTSFSSGTWKLYNLEQDSKGTFARVNWLVLKGSNDPVVYQIGLYNPNTKSEVSWLRKGASRVMMRNNAVPQQGQLAQLNPWSLVFKNNWPIFALVLVGSALLIYILILRFLFSGLLRRHWGAASAQYFTWALSLMLLLLVLAGWSYVYLGARVETWITFALSGATLLLLFIVLAVAGTKHT